MPFKFNKLDAYAYKEGALFLGHDPKTGKEVGIETERNAITIGGAGGGKGACLIIPNLMRWPHSALVIDPKGENAEMTWDQRQSRGQRVGVLDPFRAAKVPDELRVSVDLLASIDPDSTTAREDVLAIADGIVKRENDREPMWDNGAATIIAGVIAFVMSAPPQYRTFTEVRKVLLTPFGGPVANGNPSWGLYADAERMAICATCGGLARAAASSIMTAITGGRGADAEFLSGAIRHTAWLDNEAVAASLSASASTFKLEELAHDKATLYLVLPYRYLDAQAAMLRLVVRVAQNTIAAAGNRRGNHCLFILDEFFTLGRLDEIAKAAGNMRSYGLQIWPFLQDLGQLRKLYGDKESETFFANADAHCFFANNDAETLDYVSQRIGKLRPDEAAGILPFMTAFFPLLHRRFWMTENYARDRHQVKHKNAKMKYDHAVKRAGSLRFEGQEIAALTGKYPGDEVARSQIVFAPAGQILNVKLAAFFNNYEGLGYMLKTNWILDKEYWNEFFSNLLLEISLRRNYLGMIKYFAWITGGGLLLINLYRWSHGIGWYIPELQDMITPAGIVLFFGILEAIHSSHFMGRHISRWNATYPKRVELEKKRYEEVAEEVIRAHTGSTTENS